MVISLLGQDGIEPLLVEVVKDDLVAGRLELFHGGRGDGLAKAAWALMGKDDEDVHEEGFRDLGTRDLGINAGIALRACEKITW